MKILVTGGAGYIGSACTEYLLDNGHEVTVLDSLITGHRDAIDPRVKLFAEGDLADRDFVFKIMKEGNFEAVMHFAAFSLVAESMKNPSKYFHNNICSAINLADAAVETKVKVFVFSSTAATFGEPEQIPIKEDTAQNPVNPYGESKLCFEKVLKWYNKIYGMQYVALRYFNASGATEKFGEDHNPET
ncbi:MAG: UDP-glucose 4-epimerase, partial [Bacteroidetes bacterium]